MEGRERGRGGGSKMQCRGRQMYSEENMGQEDILMFHTFILNIQFGVSTFVSALSV